jgi:hypothetical protein
MRARLRALAPALASFFDREPDLLDHAALVLLVATAGARAFLFDGFSGTISAKALVLQGLTVVQIGLFVVAVGVMTRLLTLGRVRWPAAETLGATLALGLLALERTHRALFGRYFVWADVTLAWEAIHTGALRVDLRTMFSFLLACALLWLALATLLFALSRISRRPAVVVRAYAFAPYVLLLAATFGSFGPVVLGTSTDDAVSRLREVIPWDPRSGGVGPESETGETAGREPWSSSSEGHIFRLLQSRRARLLNGPLTVRTKPDVLFIHVEGLRADMVRDDVAPNLFAFARDCLGPTHHYSTGNNTGGGMFGLLNGLSPYYYPLTRKNRTQPIPLQLLRRLGYFESAYFISNLLTYEQIYDLYFKGLADFTYTGIETPVDVADARMVDAYLAARAERPPGRPYFDYVVFDSTHYDYDYPPLFERFTPVETLGVGARDGLLVGPGINAELSRRGPAIRNKYKNSILYVDSLIERILDALRVSGALDRTAVVIAGDHGEEFWEKGRFGHGTAFHEEQLRVAFLMRLPGARATRYEYGSHADVMPTLFDFMGLETPHGPFMTGKSLLGYERALDSAVAGEGLTGDQPGLWYAVMTGGQKVVFRDKEPFVIREVLGENDDAIPDYDRDLAAEAVIRALASKELR